MKKYTDEDTENNSEAPFADLETDWVDDNVAAVVSVDGKK